MATVLFGDRMKNGIKADWKVFNDQGGQSNELDYSRKGVKMRNNVFDSCSNFALLLETGFVFSPGLFFQIAFKPGELAGGKMHFYLHTEPVSTFGDESPKPFGVYQDWDHPAGSSCFYRRSGSSAGFEDTKIEIVDGDEWARLRVECMEGGTLKASVRSGQWDDPKHILGENTEGNFEGRTLYACVHNCKSWNASGGANLWKNMKVIQK